MRLAGQDSRRGTFVQRHSVLHDRANGQEWIPLANLGDNQGKFWVYDSFLSEYAAMAFEYGYSVERADALVLWEAQFGDFANGAQSVVDEFISSAEQKWGQQSSVVLLLPHGYEGQGPDHSSARIERYLQMCAQDNMTVARPSTPASYFHLLRRQAYARPRRPLIVFTPKAMLRLRGATSPVEDFLTGKFEPVLDDDRSLDRKAVKRVLLHAGKIHWDLQGRARQEPEPRDRTGAARAVLPGADRGAQRGPRQLPRCASCSGCRTSPRTRARGRSSPSRSSSTCTAARSGASRARGRVDRDRLTQGARARAGRDPEEGPDAVGLLRERMPRHPLFGMCRGRQPIPARVRRRRTIVTSTAATASAKTRAAATASASTSMPTHSTAATPCHPPSERAAAQAGARRRSCRRRRSRPCCWCARG